MIHWSLSAGNIALSKDQWLFMGSVPVIFRNWKCPAQDFHSSCRKAVAESPEVVSRSAPLQIAHGECIAEILPNCPCEGILCIPGARHVAPCLRRVMPRLYQARKCGNSRGALHPFGDELPDNPVRISNRLADIMTRVPGGQAGGRAPAVDAAKPVRSSPPLSADLVRVEGEDFEFVSALRLV